jgi:hypothetical protein
VKIFKIFENLLGEFGLELGHLGFIIRNYWLWRWVSGAWRRSMRFCFLGFGFCVGTAPGGFGFALGRRPGGLLCIWGCSSSSLTRSVTHLWSCLVFLFLSYAIYRTPVDWLGRKLEEGRSCVSVQIWKELFYFICFKF